MLSDMAATLPHHVDELTDLVDGVVITRIGSSARRYYD